MSAKSPIKPLIAVPCFQETLPINQRPRMAMLQTYIKALEAAGSVPILLPLETGEESEWVSDRFDAVLLTGGDDINPSRYKQPRHPKAETPDDLRDEVEIQIARHAIEQRQPVFAICRGLQILNVAFGGTLIQDIEEQMPEAIQHNCDYDDYHNRHIITHTAELVPESWLAQTFGETEIGVNSFHHQAIAQLADRFLPVGCAPDGIIEAIEIRDKDRFVVGVQWHPEDMFHVNNQMLNLFKAFVSVAAERRA